VPEAAFSMKLADDATNAPFAVRVTHNSGRASVISVCGEIDMETAGRLEDAFGLCGESCDVTLDLTEVTFIDSTALKLMVQNANKLRSAGHQLRLQGLSDHQRKLVRITGLERVLNVTAEC
jgi:anti-sigma B factor antagonist